MSKRAPIDQLDRNFDDIPNNSSVLKNATEEEIKARKIYTIKRPAQQEGQTSKPVSGFVFQKAEVKEPEAEKVGDQKTEGSEKNGEKRLFELKPPTTTQMFSGSISVDQNKVNTGLFFNNAKNEEKVESTAVNSQDTAPKAETTVEQPKPTTEQKSEPETKSEAKPEAEVEKPDNKSELPQNEESKDQTAKKEEQPKTGFFSGSNLFGQNQQSSLFTSNPNPLQGTNQPSLFGNVQSSIFNTGSSLFGTTEAKPSIFSNVGTGFFKNVNENDEEEDGDDGDEDQKEEEEAPEDLAATTNQDPNMTTICIKNCKNFKVDNNEALGMGYVSIEQPKDNPKMFLLIFRNKTKRILHNSLIIPKLSQSIYMKGKKTAMTVLTLGMKKDEETGSIPKHYAKLGFETEDDAAGFKAEVEKIFNM